MATKTLLSSIHYGAVATYAPIKGLKNHLAIFALLGNIQASNLTQFVADEDLRGRNVLLLTSFLLRELLHTLTSLCFRDARRRSQHRCRHFVWRSQQCCRHVVRRSQKFAVYVCDYERILSLYHSIGIISIGLRTW